MPEYGWAIAWKDFEIDGYTDYFAPGALAKPTKRLVHQVVGPRGWRGFATCEVRISGRQTILDYRAFAKENVRAGMDVGVMTVIFGRQRRQIDFVEWQSPGKKSTRVKVEASVRTPPDPGPYSPKKGKLRKSTTIAIRGPQGSFRIAARAAYGDRCAISGCDISEALEAAHIDPFENASQHHPRNALLLRKDLHALFDLSLIAINPKTMMVEVTPALRRYKEYASLHRRRKLRRPERGYEAHRPDHDALTRRWKIWRANASAD